MPEIASEQELNCDITHWPGTTYEQFLRSIEARVPVTISVRTIRNLGRIHSLSKTNTQQELINKLLARARTHRIQRLYADDFEDCIIEQNHGRERSTFVPVHNSTKSMI